MNIGNSNRWLAMVAVFAMGSLLALAAQSVVRSGETATVVGKLESATAYGPPNFGENPETDKKEPYIALALLSPIDVRDTDGTVLANIQRAQLIVPSEQHDALTRKLKQLVGSGAVKVIGQVFPATTGHHHEPVVLIVESVEKAK
jgi:hypothetical protein